MAHDLYEPVLSQQCLGGIPLSRSLGFSKAHALCLCDGLFVTLWAQEDLRESQYRWVQSLGPRLSLWNGQAWQIREAEGSGSPEGQKGDSKVEHSKLLVKWREK